MLGIAVTFIVCLVVRVSAAIRQACLRVSWSCFRDPPTHTLGLGTANKFHLIPNNNGRSQGEARIPTPAGLGTAHKLRITSLEL